ncbi:MAG: tail fiber domain-containing protein [Terriglobales bacterium]
MKQVRLATLSLLIVLLCSLMSPAQQKVTTAANATVPPLIPFSNVATDEGGSSLSGVLQITFSLYNAQQGGTPLWTETQNNIQLDSTGHYSVQLGITKPNGVPTTLFTTGEARWLGVRIAEQVEQPRVLLLSVPYALKAGDAATIGGLPPSAFVLAAPLSGSVSASGGEPVTGQGGPPPSGDVTGTGTVNYLPLWDSTSDITSSALFQKGTGSTAKIGINTNTPATTLDVKGGGTIRGTLGLPATGAATATVGKNSQPLNLAASAFNSTSSTAVNQTFQWQSEPARNDTGTPSGTLNLLFGEGATKPSETGLNIANNGQITFASGQTFPGTGTLTGITTASGSGLTGGGTSGTLNLGLLNSCATNQVLQWNGSSWACAAVGTGTVTSVATGLGLKGGPIKTSGTLTIDTTVVPQLGAANIFNGNQTVFGTLTLNSGSLGLSATAASVNGVAGLGISSAPTGDGVGFEGQTYAPSGQGVYGTNFATTGTAAGVLGITQSTTGYGVEGQNDAQTGVAVGVYGYTQSPSGYGVEGVANSAGTAGFFQANGGNILQGNNGSQSEFVVTSAGVVNANAVIVGGEVSASNFQIGGQPFAYGNHANVTTFLGFGAGSGATGVFDIGIGYHALNQDTGGNNVAVGPAALVNSTTGGYNVAVGYSAGLTNDSSNLTGSGNTALGAYALFGTGTLTNATAIGSSALVSESNALVLGAVGTNVGIGTSAPGHLLDVAGTVAFDSTGLNNGTNFLDLTFGLTAGEGISSSRTAGPNQYGIDIFTDFARRISIAQHGNVGIGTATPSNLLTLVQGGGAALADGWNTYSSRRWKTNIQPLQNALGKVEQLRGVSYDLKGSGKHEIGVIAEEVGAVVPEVVTYEENGKDARGVDYSRLTALLIEATKQQQREFRQQGTELAKALLQIKQQQNLLRAQSAAMRGLQAEVRETRESLRKVKAQIVAAKPSLIAAK